MYHFFFYKLFFCSQCLQVISCHYPQNYLHLREWDQPICCWLCLFLIPFDHCIHQSIGKKLVVFQIVVSLPISFEPSPNFVALMRVGALISFVNTLHFQQLFHLCAHYLSYRKCVLFNHRNFTRCTHNKS